MGGAPAPPPPQRLYSHLTIQPPLSRGGRGPGLILIADHYAHLEPGETTIEPAPLVKWAEEGYAVAQIRIPGKPNEGGEFPLQRAMEGLKALDECDWGRGVGVISYLHRVPYYVSSPLCQNPDILAIVSYGGRTLSSFSDVDDTPKPLPPQLVHVGGANSPRRDSPFACSSSATGLEDDVAAACDSISSSCSSKDPCASATAAPKLALEKDVVSHRYVDASAKEAWFLPADPAYHAESAELAHARTAEFLRPLLEGSKD